MRKKEGQDNILTHSLEWGRLGNQLFTVAATIGLARKFGKDPKFKEWEYNQYLLNPIPVYSKWIKSREVPEERYEYTPNYWSIVLSNTGQDNITLTGWFQSEKYFNNCPDVKKHFQIISSVKRATLPNDKPIIGISIRKGKDYEENGNYEILPITYYIAALEKFFPQWRENYNILVFSDEMEYARFHFQGDNIYYADGTDIEQLASGELVTHWILSNSTFAWWLAWLHEKPESVIVRPSKYFRGDLEKTHSTVDLWPERWHEFNNDTLINLKDVTFTIPVHIDHEDRRENLDLTLDYLENYFDTNITIGEWGNNVVGRATRKFELTDFHRTKMLNVMADEATTPYIANWDADVILSPLQLLNAVHQLRRGFADVVYPYDGRFARVPRKDWYKKISKDLDTYVFARQEFRGTMPDDAISLGGAVLFNRESFISGGMENENMVGYAPEDTERYTRFSILGYKVKRVFGIIYHLDHFISYYSSMDTPHHKANVAEFVKELEMSPEELLEYVDTWEWVNKYTDKYYENIVDDAIESGHIILRAVANLFPEIQDVLDVSGGIGEFSKGAISQNWNYIMTDYRINKKKLIVPQYLYKEFDLRKPNDTYPFHKKFDLVICTEVFEHISNELAEKNVELLCSKGKVILFSAAIPYQGGQFHINEQWQSYWASLFEKFGYHPYKYDIRQVLRNTKASNWYKQNLIIYTPFKYIPNYPLDFVLPQIYINAIQHYKK